jgi:hypothetical protein
MPDTVDPGTETTLDDGAVHHFWHWYGRLLERPNLSNLAAFLAAVDRFDIERPPDDD